MGRRADATRCANEYALEVLPRLSNARQELETKFAGSAPDVTLANVLTVQRGYLKAAETWLDARYEVSLAEADLATAELALGPPPGAKQATGVSAGK